ncbi:MAG: hypothetical protein SFY81_07890 [Verrucomicrobiota bacterium]|nr:hypothetical protein [Verrucomicrobiota bacterium]
MNSLATRFNGPWVLSIPFETPEHIKMGAFDREVCIYGVKRPIKLQFHGENNLRRLQAIGFETHDEAENHYPVFEELLMKLMVVKQIPIRIAVEGSVQYFDDPYAATKAARTSRLAGLLEHPEARIDGFMDPDTCNVYPEDSQLRRTRVGRCSVSVGYEGRDIAETFNTRSLERGEKLSYKLRLALGLWHSVLTAPTDSSRLLFACMALAAC